MCESVAGNDGCPAGDVHLLFHLWLLRLPRVWNRGLPPDERASRARVNVVSTE